jgi:hypothetical protein
MINSYLKFCRRRYNVQLESIAVNGQVLPIDSVVFSKGGMETFLDSGTTLAFLPPLVYDILINSVSLSSSFFAFEICLRVIISIYTNGMG